MRIALAGFVLGMAGAPTRAAGDGLVPSPEYDHAYPTASTSTPQRSLGFRVPGDRHPKCKKARAHALAFEFWWTEGGSNSRPLHCERKFHLFDINELGRNTVFMPQ